MNGEEITADKVAFAFTTMAVAGRGGRFTADDIARSVVALQSDCIAALLNDETDATREKVAERLTGLWAIYEEHHPQGNPWE